MTENEGVQPLMSNKDNLGNELCSQFHNKDECKNHFIQNYDLYMLEYYNYYVEKNGNDLHDLQQDLKNGRVSILSVQEQRNRFAQQSL